MRLPSHQSDLHEMNGATIVLIVWDSDNQNGIPTDIQTRGFEPE